MLLKSFKNQSGQSLLELVVAIAVITVGLFSVWNLFISNFNGEQEAGARILAVNLAREGIEIVKNIRDSNWLAIENNDPCSYNGVLADPCRWDSGLDGDGTAIIANIFSENVYLDYSAAATITDEATKLYIDAATGLYSHNISDQPTRYRRLIALKNLCCADTDGNLRCDDVSVDFIIKDTACLASELKVGLEIRSTVHWQIKGQERELAVDNKIYNWK